MFVGRIDFYDEYGIIRDVMQNHLTELLALVSMDLPHDITNTREVNKMRSGLLRQVRSVTRENTVTGQYSKYLEEALEEKDNITTSKFTPTFGASLLDIHNVRWSGVPILLVSGKHLDERSSFIRIVFKDTEFCIAGCHHHNGSHWKGQEQIIFQIGHGNLPSAGILISKDLFSPNVPNTMEILPVTADHLALYGQSLNEFVFLVPLQNTDAYVTLIEDMYRGRQENFVSTERLMALWDIWTPLINSISETVPKLYMEKEDRSLNFKITSEGLRFVHDTEYEYHREILHPRIVSLPSTFLDSKVKFDQSDELLSKQAAIDIMEIIHRSSIDGRNVNIAFSGGTTPLKLLKNLALSAITWDHVHIWQVDERCVTQTDHNSNFNTIHEELLKYVSIPYVNIHPMPVQSGGRLCHNKDNGAQVYEDDIKFHVFGNSSHFDIIILGVGTDGHTASLFPGNAVVKETSSLVSLVIGESVKPSRMTLTLPAINKSSRIFVLVTGKKKHGIVLNLMNKTKSVLDYPMLGVHPSQGNMTWYIDYDAWIGE